MAVEGKIEIRVRYNETDGQGRVHHAQYLNYFERGRVELLRELGYSYKAFEETGLMLVVAEMNVRYLNAAEFDDLLTPTTRVNRVRRVRIFHDYVLEGPDGQAIVEASSTIACVDRAGKLQALPEYLRAS